MDDSGHETVTAGRATPPSEPTISAADIERVNESANPVKDHVHI
jgi:hypothetical protein